MIIDTNCSCKEQIAQLKKERDYLIDAFRSNRKTCSFCRFNNQEIYSKVCQQCKLNIVGFPKFEIDVEEK